MAVNIKKISKAYLRRKISRNILSIRANALDISPLLKSFLKKNAYIFEKYPNLWIKGGGARASFISFVYSKYNMWYKPPESIRDIDLILISDNKEDKIHLYEDFNGQVDIRDIEVQPSISKYMLTRDLAINQVALRPEKLLFSKQSFENIKNKIVYPAQKEYDSEHGEVSARIAIRGVLLALREGLEPSQALLNSLYKISDANLLIHLFKAFETGVQDKFTTYVSPYSFSAEKTLLYLLKKIPNFRLTTQQEKLVNLIRREQYYEKYK